MRAFAIAILLLFTLGGAAHARDLPTVRLPPPNKVRIAAFSLGGVTLVIFGAALATGLFAQSDFDQLNKVCGPARDRCPEGFESERSRGLSLQGASWGLSGAAVGGLIGTIAMFFAPTHHERGPASRPLVMPLVVPGGGGVAAAFAF